MIGLRTGLATGLRTGAAIGIGADPIQASTGGTTTTQTVTVADSADPVITGGDAFAYTVQYTNTGSITATTVSVAVTLDASLAYVSSSGTGWTIGVAGQVVTCTRASAAAGAAPAITVNVTTGGSALTASTSAQATASNAGTANGSQTTTVNLVSKDATSGIYLPASSTEWSNFLTRKGLSAATPDSLHLLQEASGSPADSIGSFTLTVTGTPTYQTAQTGWTRKGISFTDGQAAALATTSASLPDVASASLTTLAIVNVSATPASSRTLLRHGTTTHDDILITLTPRVRASSGANTTDGAASPTTVVRPYAMRTNRTAGSCVVTTDVDKLTPTFGSTITGKQIELGLSGSAPPCNTLYMAHWFNTNAEISDANLKALLQAMGFTVTWT